jgi:hypothetical protein
MTSPFLLPTEQQAENNDIGGIFFLSFSMCFWWQLGYLIVQNNACYPCVWKQQAPQFPLILRVLVGYLSS